MHNNYYLIRRVTKELQNLVLGWKVGECFSQNKDELIIILYEGRKEFYIRADQRASFSCLSFPDHFKRAKKNSIDLFSSIVGLSVSGINQYPNERAFQFNLEKGYILLFKLYGNQSNIILFKEGSVDEIFRNNLKKDLQVSLTSIGKEIMQDKESFTNSGGDIRRLYPIFDRTILKELDRQGYKSLSLEDKWILIQQIIQELNSGDIYIHQSGDKIKLTLFKPDNYIRKDKNPILSLTYFYHRFIKNESLVHEKQTLLNQVNRSIRSGKNYIKNNQQKLTSIQSQTGYDKIANIIMANLDNIEKGLEEVKLFNFYTNKEVTIKLKKGLSPQKSAENYYRKFKNQEKEIRVLEKNIGSRKKEVQRLEKIKKLIEEFDDLKSIRALTKKETQGDHKKGKSPFKTYKAMDFEILVGRNAKNNDELTFQSASKEDMWLHARGVAGSHVVIKHKPGSPYPKPVIEKAAQLAAFYSKYRNESTSPVAYTLRKYVGKRKGLAPGEVTVEKEKVIFVEPMDFSS